MSNGSMIRIQSYFPKRLLEDLREVAKKENVSMAEAIRVSAEDFVDKVSKSKTFKGGASILLKSARKISFSGPRNLSKKVDKYIYGK